jgi:6,7-dimethyl-8-ribityllumazine synthase
MIAIIKANFNSEITNLLLQGCINELNGQQFVFEVWEVPGAVEIVGLASQLSKQNKYQAIITIGAVIKGDTDHYTYVCEYVTVGLLQLSISSPIPIVFGILTTQTEELAKERAAMNKGKEFASCAIEMIALYKKI